MSKKDKSRQCKTKQTAPPKCLKKGKAAVAKGKSSLQVETLSFVVVVVVCLPSGQKERIQLQPKMHIYYIYKEGKRLNI